MSKAPKKIGSMGPAFAQLTQILDYCEDRIHAFENHGRQPTPVVAKKLGSCIEYIAKAHDFEQWSDSFLDFINKIVMGWAADAVAVRASFKFKALHDDLMTLKSLNPALGEVEVRLPFPHCTLVLNEPTADATTAMNPEMKKRIHSTVFFMETRFLDEDEDGSWYQKQGMRLGDEFICITMGLLVEPGDPLFYIPAEFHVKSGVSLDDIQWTSGAPRGTPQEIIDGLPGYGAFAVFALTHWLGAINSPQVRRDLTTGIKPGHVHTPRRKERVFYEHTLLTIDPQKPVDIKDPMGHHAKHRLHPVRGFWRNYKSGKRTWVTPHWRGDKELGVVTHDYEVVNEYEVEDAD